MHKFECVHTNARMLTDRQTSRRTHAYDIMHSSMKKMACRRMGQGTKEFDVVLGEARRALVDTALPHGPEVKPAEES